MSEQVKVVTVEQEKVKKLTPKDEWPWLLQIVELGMPFAIGFSAIFYFSASVAYAKELGIVVLFLGVARLMLAVAKGEI